MLKKQSTSKSKSSIHQRIFDLGFFLMVLWAVFNIWLNLGYVGTEIKVNSVDIVDDVSTVYVTYRYDGILYSNTEMPVYHLTEEEQSTGKKFYAYISKSNHKAWVNRYLVETLHFIILPALLFIVIGYCFDEKNLERVSNVDTNQVMIN